MYSHSYAKFFSFVALALVVGFVGMEAATGGVPDAQLSGMAAAGSPTGSVGVAPIIYLALGIALGAGIVATVFFLGKHERSRL